LLLSSPFLPLKNFSYWMLRVYSDVGQPIFHCRCIHLSTTSRHRSGPSLAACKTCNSSSASGPRDLLDHHICLCQPRAPVLGCPHAPAGRRWLFDFWLADWLTGNWLVDMRLSSCQCQCQCPPTALSPVACHSAIPVHPFPWCEVKREKVELNPMAPALISHNLDIVPAFCKQ
jgi:hypothetical protein